MLRRKATVLQLAEDDILEVHQEVEKQLQEQQQEQNIVFPQTAKFTSTKQVEQRIGYSSLPAQQTLRHSNSSN